MSYWGKLMKPDESDVAREKFRRQMAELVGNVGRKSDGDEPWWATAATQPRHAERELEQEGSGSLRPEDGETPQQPLPENQPESEFVPLAPDSLSKAGLHEGQVEALILKFLLNRSTATGRETAEQIKLPLGVIAGLLRRLKEERLAVYKASAPMSDYVYELTELGLERAKRYNQQCTYFGAAPVPLDQYVASVRAQSIRRQNPRLNDLRKAFHDLVLSEQVLCQLGQSIVSGLCLFLYGAPGNGKTSIAERITRAFSESIWIPRALNAVGEVIRLYDPNNHEALPAETTPAETPPAETLRAESPEGLAGKQEIDRRWIRIRRPTIIAGGELTMENLDISTNRATGLCEAPLQVKSNGGTLVIDDFGRQRITPAELLSRWMVPLEKRYDVLNLAGGRIVQVPFDLLIVFSTNLQPKELVDEAFLRRIPYKIDVKDPSEEEFRILFKRVATEMGIEYQHDPVDYLLEKHYKAAGRPTRFCHPRDLLRQVEIFCTFHERPLLLTTEAIDAAVKNYFAMM